MSDDDRYEVHQMNERLSRLLGWIRWIAGGVGAVVFAAAMLWLEMEGRVSSLEASRDNTAETIKRIDRNVEDLARYLRGQN